MPSPLGKVRGLSVTLDDGRSVDVDPEKYGHLDHGYALTIHKAQGMTVDRAYVLATPSMRAQTTYVAMTRHRLGVRLYAGAEDFEGRGGLAPMLSRVAKKEFSPT